MKGNVRIVFMSCDLFALFDSILAGRNPWCQTHFYLQCKINMSSSWAHRLSSLRESILKCHCQLSPPHTTLYVQSTFSIQLCLRAHYQCLAVYDSELSVYDNVHTLRRDTKYFRLSPVVWTRDAVYFNIGCPYCIFFLLIYLLLLSVSLQNCSQITENLYNGVLLRSLIMKL